MTTALSLQVAEAEQNGAIHQDAALGFHRMPDGYALMLNADQTHYYWLRDDGAESAIHWNKWRIYQWAKNEPQKQKPR